MKLYNEDCLEVLKTMPDKSIDLVVTDCPYHIVSGGCTKDPVKIGRYTEVRKDSHGNKFYTESNHVSLCGILNDADPATYTKQGKLFKHNNIKFSDWLPEVYRVLKDGTHCYVMINPRNLKDLQTDAENAGFIFQQLIVWDKGNQTPNKFYLNAYELILMLRKGKAKRINNMGTKNIIRVPNITGNKIHPTEKSVELMEILVGNSTNENEIVLDPFMGGGGAGVACKNLNRDFIGIEIDERYFEIARQRIELGIEPERNRPLPQKKNVSNQLSLF